MKQRLWITTKTEIDGTTSKFWLNMQNELDLREAEIKLEKELENIPSYKNIA